MGRAAAPPTARLSRTDEKLVEFSNGCICCTLRDDLLDQLDACCLTDAEMDAGSEAWLDLPDPFPAWLIATDADDASLGDSIEV